MNWLRHLLPRRRTESPQAAELRETLAHWSNLPPANLDRPHRETRYVVLNTRASGVSAERDTLLSVAAIAVDGGRIHPAHSFHAVLDDDIEMRLTELVSFVGAGPAVVFNAELNRRLLERAFRQHLGITPQWAWLDLYWLLPLLFPEHHLDPTRLAVWMQTLGIDTFQRFHALGDAHVLARMLLLVQARALARGHPSARSLMDLEHVRRQADRN